MRALITGVTGFAGSYLAEHLLECGDEVLGCSTSGRWRADAPRALAAGVEVFPWDLGAARDGAAVDRLINYQPDVIYHLAALSIPSDCGGSEPNERARMANIESVRTITDAAAMIDSCRVVLVSSCYVYAAVTPSSPTVHEQSPIGPERAYGKSKLAAEGVFAEAVAKGLDGVVARAFQHTGPRQSPRMVLPQWAQQLATPSDDPLAVICLDAYLDLSDVRDIRRAYRALAVDGHSGTTYNVGSGRAIRSGDLLEIVQRIAGTQRSVEELHPGRRQHPIADISRITRDTGWTPQIPLEQTVTDTLDHWRQRTMD